MFIDYNSSHVFLYFPSMFFKFQTSRKVAKNCIMNIHALFTYSHRLPTVNTLPPLSQTSTHQTRSLADYRAFAVSFPWKVLLFSTCPNLIHTLRPSSNVLYSMKLALLNSPSARCVSFYTTDSSPLGSTVKYIYVSHPLRAHGH